MDYTNLDAVLAELKSSSENEQDFLMAHFLLLIPQLEALDQAIENSSDVRLIVETAQMRKVIPDLMQRIVHIAGK
ncbi:MAG: hypothetical protein ACOYOA_15250 [Saprospiraceae bacterium]